MTNSCNFCLSENVLVNEKQFSWICRYKLIVTFSQDVERTIHPFGFQSASWEVGCLLWCKHNTTMHFDITMDFTRFMDHHCFLCFSTISSENVYRCYKFWVFLCLKMLFFDLLCGLTLLTAGLALSSFKDIHARAMIAGNLQVYYSTQVQVKWGESWGRGLANERTHQLPLNDTLAGHSSWSKVLFLQ